MSRLARLFLKVFPAVAAFSLLAPGSRCLAQPQAVEKIPLHILYAGRPGSAREADFLAFLEQHFRKVDTASLRGLTDETAGKADVVLLDWDGDGFKAPRPRLSEDYARPTVTIGVAGGLWASGRRLKTGYT